MYVFGHVGLTLTAARAADREVDWRPVAVLALLPDLVDKPIAWLSPRLVHWNTRNYGHTLLAWVVVALAVAAWRPRSRRAWLLWGCFAGHALLDRMWLSHNPRVFLWPFRGPFPPPLIEGPGELDAFAYNVFGELLGIALLARLYRRGALKNPKIGP